MRPWSAHPSGSGMPACSPAAGSRRATGRRREIDLIVCTPQVIHLIEAKNWSGRLEVLGGDWRQTRRSGGGRAREPARRNRLKRDAVVEYLNDRGLDLDERFVRDHIAPKVIFTNPRLELDPTVEALPEVISRGNSTDTSGGSARGAWPSGWPRRCSRSASTGKRGWRGRPRPGAIPPDRYGKIVESLAEVGTWDRLEFHGTRVVAGDVVSLRVGARTYRRPELLATGGPPADPAPVDEGAVLGPVQGRDRTRAAREPRSRQGPHRGLARRHGDVPRRRRRESATKAGRAGSDRAGVRPVL